MPSQTVDFLYKVDAALAGLFVSLVSNVDGVTKYSATVTSDVNGKWAINPKPPAGPYALYTGAAQGVLTTLVDPDFVVDPFNDDGTAVFPKQVTISAGGLVVTAGGINVATGGLTVAAGGAAITGATSLNFNAGTVLVVNRTDVAAGLMTHIAFQRAAANKWWLGVDALDQFALLNAAGNTVNVGVTDAGLMTVRGGVAITAGGLAVTAGGFTVTGFSTVIADVNNGLLVKASAAMPGANAVFLVQDDTAAGLLTVSKTGVVAIKGTIDSVAAGQLQIGPAGGNASSVAIRSPLKALIVAQGATAFGAGAQTMTAANMLAGLIEGTPTAAAAYTFDTGANLDAAITNVSAGDTFVFTIANRSAGAFAITLTAAAGVTIVGNGVIGQSKVATVYMRRAGAASWGAYVTVSA